MNIAYRKFAMLEKNFIAKEQEAITSGYFTGYIDTDLKNRITKVLDHVRYL